VAPCAAGFRFASAYALDLSQSAMFLTWHVRPAGPRTGSLAASSAGSSVGAGWFLMTGHEVGAALGVAVLSAVASTAGSLAGLEGVAAGFSRGLFAGGTYAMTYAARYPSGSPAWCCWTARAPNSSPGCHYRETRTRNPAI
jgi:hypothetical protein